MTETRMICEGIIEAVRRSQHGAILITGDRPYLERLRRAIYKQVPRARRSGVALRILNDRLVILDLNREVVALCQAISVDSTSKSPPRTE